MAYSEVADLLIGDLVLGAGVDPQKYIDLAAEQIDAKIGWVYELPLHPAGGVGTWQDLPEHEQLLLKGINNGLASGSLLIALDQGGEQTTVHAYGLWLIQQAQADLMYLANGEIQISAELFDVPDTVPNRVPGVINYDEESLLLGFENTVLRRDKTGWPWYSRPGALK